jgi:pimeloyl-ACP methyl ester carboxylesterase
MLVAIALSAVMRLAVPGNADAFYVEPRLDGEQTVIMVLHAKKGDPEDDCRKWSSVASDLGWVVCPSGSAGDEHARSWGKVDEAESVIEATMTALRARFGARVKPAGNVLVGFSEGAFIAQLVAVTHPDRWNRWLILGGSDKYWGDRGPAMTFLHARRRQIARVVMLTGEHDLVREHTLRAGAMLREAKIPVRVIIRKGLGHDVPANAMVANYQASLRWLFDVK